MCRKHAIVAIALLLLSPAVIHAQVIAYSSTLQAGNQGWPGNMGLDFDVNNPITILALGAFDNNGDGFSGSVRVAIFNRDTSALATPAVTFTGTGGALIKSDRFQNLSPAVTLPPGHYSIVAVGFSNTDLNANLGNDGAVGPVGDTGSGAISFVGTGRYDFNTTLDLPELIDGGPANRYSAGTFQFVTSVALKAPISTGRFVTPFGSDVVNIGDTVALTIMIENPNSMAITGVRFTDVLPIGLQVAAIKDLTGSCGTGSVAVADGNRGISVTNITIAAISSCTVSIDATTITGGVQTNTTSTVTSNEAPAGAPASAQCFVSNLWWWFL